MTKHDVVQVIDSGEIQTVTIKDEGVVAVETGAATVISMGIQGPAGPQGPPGPGDKNFVLAFTNQASVTVAHNLGKRPAVAVEDSAGDEVEGDVSYLDLNTISVNFSASFTGRIICN